MSREDPEPQGKGKDFVSDLRDTVGRKVAENEGSIRDKLGRAARWVDGRTGGKYSDRIGQAEAKVGEGLGRVAAQNPPPAAPPGPGAPRTPDAFADAPTPPSGTPMPGTARDVRDESPTGPIPPTGPPVPPTGPPAQAGTEPVEPGEPGAGRTEPLRPDTP